jgi:hypothetical protein
MIEIGERTKFEMTYEEALMYCFSLNIDGKIGWRLPTIDEYMNTKGITNSMCWCIGRTSGKGKWYVTPVRDLKDD